MQNRTRLLTACAVALFATWPASAADNPTPAQTAAESAKANAFFDRFLDGAAVGELVLGLRRDFLRDHGNPLGKIVLNARR